MGQGVLTSLSMVLAEELEVDWTQIKAEHALTDPKKYGRQLTGGSSSISGNYRSFREAGAAAREMLIAAAAAEWKVRPAECRAEKGAVLHPPTHRSFTYGQLAAHAARLTPPAKPELELKPADQLALIGKPQKRIDVPAKVKGEAIFGIDVKVPGMLIARVIHPPLFGAKLKSFDAVDAEKTPGVREVLEIPTGVAVVADHFWAAKTGADQLDLDWELGAHGELSTEAITEHLTRIVSTGVEARKEGDPAPLIARAPKARKVQAVYEVPYLAHATMEPLNCTADVHPDRCEIWVPTQAQSSVQQAAAKILNLPIEKIVIHTTFLGGGFGRKAQTDFAEDAIHLSKEIKKQVKVIWAREDDMRGGWYRPAAYNQLEGALDKDGWPIAWVHKIASPSILELFSPLQGGIDHAAVEGAQNLPYAIPNLQVSYAKAELPISTWFWRSVGSSQNAYVTECFLDELAALGKKDPLEVRRRLLDGSPRHKRVLEIAAEKAGWGQPLPEGRARGLAVHFCFGSYVAQIAEVSIGQGGRPQVHRVVCAVDSGQVVNPQTIVAQMESAIVYGLSAALYGRLDFAGGQVKQGNFDTYPILRLNEMPVIETHVVPSGDSHGGIGEPGTPPIAPAVANALFALTKKPIRKLPIVPPTA
jgi:isoquinoline 1-oxidoreductase beta subunit